MNTVVAVYFALEYQEEDEETIISRLDFNCVALDFQTIAENKNYR